MAAQPATRQEVPLRRDLEPLENLEKAGHCAERLAVKTSSGISFLSTDELHWVDAAGNYVRLNTQDGESHLLRETLTALEKRLDPNRFVRVHRSTIVNVEHIKEIRAQSHGEHLIIMETGQRLTLSRGYRDRVHDLILRA